jgi:hypothetical protein
MENKAVNEDELPTLTEKENRRGHPADRKSE